jgi:transcriptional regulator with XRE-family HTH domain
MPTRERLAALGTAHGTWLVRQLGDELRNARLAAGLSQLSVASAARLSQGSVSRLEHAKPPHPDIVEALRVARVVGLELSVRCFPAAGQLRDVAHVGLIHRLLKRIPPDISRQLEAPVRRGDLRAWDVLLQVGGVRIGVIAETRIRDLQALLRREKRKQMDGNIDRLLLLVADTKHNRATLEEASSLLLLEFPLATRAMLTRLSRSKAPSANGIVVL